jgi:hypothetical protein
MHPRPRSHIYKVVGGPDRLLVVLDDDERVPEVPQPHEGVEQSPIVPLVQPDGRLVEDVENANETAADLGGEPDALGFTTRQSTGGATQR